MAVPHDANILIPPCGANISRRQGNTVGLLVVYIICAGHNTIPGLRKIYKDGEVVQGRLDCFCLHYSTTMPDGSGPCRVAIWDE